MDELGFNKLAAAGLATVLAFLGVRTLAEVVVPESEFEAIYVPDVDLGTAVEEEDADPAFDHPDFIAAMDPARGETVFKKCLSCHNVERGGPNGTGPNMWGVMGRQMGTHPGFAYSAAMSSRAAPWTWEEMNGFLVRPKDWIPGTAMNYIGLRKWEDRAAVMAYLNANTDNPLPLPEPAAVEVDVVEAGLIEPGELPDSEPGPEVLTGSIEEQTTARIVTEPKVDDIPGQPGMGESISVNDGGDSADDVPLDDVLLIEEGVPTDPDNSARVLEDEFQSAGQVEPEDMTPAVEVATDGEESSVNGPLDESQVLDYLNRRGR